MASDLLQSDPSSLESARARDAIDAAVVEILAVAGLPRGPINGPIVDDFNRGWFGRKVEDCRLLVDIRPFADLSEAERPGTLVKTWIHESLHARLPYSAGFRQEWQEARGYEEGLAEGLTRLVAVEWIGLQPVLAGHQYYVVAYRVLAAVLKLDVEALWRALWRIPAGDVRAAFMPAIERILQEDGRASLSELRRVRIAALCDLHFSGARSAHQPDKSMLITTFRSIV